MVSVKLEYLYIYAYLFVCIIWKSMVSPKNAVQRGENCQPKIFHWKKWIFGSCDQNRFVQYSVVCGLEGRLCSDWLMQGWAGCFPMWQHDRNEAKNRKGRMLILKGTWSLWKYIYKYINIYIKYDEVYILNCRITLRSRLGILQS